MRCFTLVLLSSLLAGCATRTCRFDGIGADGTPGREVRYTLESEAGREGVITLRLSGKEFDRVDERDTDTVRLTMTVDNYTHDAAVELPITLIALTDDENRKWQPLSVARPAGSTGDMATTEANQRASYSLVFDAGAAGAIRTTGSLTFDWSYWFRGAELQHQTRFLPVRIERQRVYWSGGLWIGGYQPLYWRRP